MRKLEKHKWTFPARFRAGAYSWKSSRLACQRLREAVSEIRKVARKDPALGAEGTVRLMEKLWPALAPIDTSSGALGSAVNKALEALMALGRKAEAVRYAEASRGLNQSDSVIDQTCEEILISSGLQEEAYQRYGLSAAVGNSYIARFRALAKRYPAQDKLRILADLIATTPGDEGKWFATAKELGLLDLALELANRSHCDPKTLTRAARDYLDTEPVFALGCAMAALHWLSQGWGYEVTRADVVEAYDRALEAASRLDKVDAVEDQIRQLVESSESASVLFVRQSLHGCMHKHP